MKNTMFFLVVLIASSLNFLTAQDRLPSQRKLMYNGIDSVLFQSGDSNFIKLNGLLIGFHWTNESSISESILANQNNVYAQNMMLNTTTPDLRLIQKNALLMVEGVVNGQAAGVFSHVLGDTGILNARHFSFKPNMLITFFDITQYQMLSKRPYDTTNPIFGFQYIHPFALANNKVLEGDSNYSFLLIPNISLKDSVICSGPWGSEYLWRSFGNIINLF